MLCDNHTLIMQHALKCSHPPSKLKALESIHTSALTQGCIVHAVASVNYGSSFKTPIKAQICKAAA